MRVKKAIIPAAGLGVRFLPATKAQPKEMLPIVDKPTIQYIVEEAIASGIEDILIITGRNKRAIEDHFDKSLELEVQLREKNKTDLLHLVEGISSMTDIHYVRQKEPKGLGHAVYCARKFIGNEPFAVLLGDDIVRSEVPCLRQMLDLHERIGGSIVAVMEVAQEDVSKYGILEAKETESRVYKISNLIEKPTPEAAPSNLAVMGRYVISPAIFDILANTRPGAGGEIQLTDGLKTLLHTENIYGYAFEGRRYDVGDKMGYIQATIELALEREDLSGELRRYLRRLGLGSD